MKKLTPKQADWRGVKPGTEASDWVTDEHTLFPAALVPAELRARLNATTRTSAPSLGEPHLSRSVRKLLKSCQFPVKPCGRVTLETPWEGTWHCEVFQRSRARVHCVTVQTRKLDFAKQVTGEPDRYTADADYRFVAAYRGRTLLFMIAATRHGADDPREVRAKLAA